MLRDESSGAKWTPGPWEVNAYGNHREIQQVDPDGISIAIMSAGSEADARLIAAAPDLYAAAKALTDPHPLGDRPILMDRLRKVVRKAEGGDS